MDMLKLRYLVSLASVIACLTVAPRAAGEYPLTLTLEAKASTGATAVISTVTVRVAKLMEESRWKRVTDALKYGGFANFMTALRPLPAIGTIEFAGRSVEIKYAREGPPAPVRRLVILGDGPLFFMGGDAAKSRAGYQLTIIELLFDPDGGVTGTMAGAARVKPSPDGVVLDDYSQTPVHLSGRTP